VDRLLPNFEHRQPGGHDRGPDVLVVHPVKIGT
jgi:hypothetical protein